MSIVRYCKYPDCERKCLAKGYCNFHYYRDRQGKRMDVTPRKHFAGGAIMIEIYCSNCGKPRTIRRSVAENYPLCVSCSAKNRDAEYIAKHGHGRNWRGSTHFSGKIIRSWERGAESRNIAWELDGEFLDLLYEKQEGLCALTGAKLSFDEGNTNKISLDRINPKLSYIDGNVQLVCAYVNICKQSLTNREFIEMCRLVSDITCYYE